MGLRAILILSISLIACLYSLIKPFWGLCFFAFINYVRPERFSYDYLADFRIPLISSICILIGWLLHKNDFKIPAKRSWTVLSLFGLSAILLISSFFAEYDSSLSFQWAQVLLKIAVYCYLMTRLIDSKEKLAWFVGVNLLAAAFLGVWGFEQHFRGNPRLEGMAGGQFDEANSMAALWVLTLPMFMVLFFRKGATYKLISVMLCPILLSSIVFTQSRAALLGLGVAAFLLLMLVNTRLKIGLVAASGLLFLVFNWAATGTPGYQERVDNMLDPEETGGRWEIWEVGYEVFKDHPFLGVGAQNFQYLAKSYFVKLGKPVFFKERADAHNTALIFLIEGGIFAFLLYLLCVFFSIRDLLILYHLSKTDRLLSEYKPFIWALGAGILGFFTCSMFHSYPFYETFYWFLVIPSIGKNIYFSNLSQRPATTQTGATVEKAMLTASL